MCWQAEEKLPHSGDLLALHRKQFGRSLAITMLRCHMLWASQMTLQTQNVRGGNKNATTLSHCLTWLGPDSEEHFASIVKVKN
jgi:hypothetical protein